MVLRYWPNQKGLELNKEVAYLFLITKKKLSSNLFKLTDIYLHIDILDETIRKQLFIIVLNQLKILILDIVELDLEVNNIQLLNYKILYDLIQKVLINFLNTVCLYDKLLNLSKDKNYYYSKIVRSEHKLLLENLLIYLIFGSNKINNYMYAFDNKKTPNQHVSILLENFIIQISNLVISMLFENMNSLSEVVNFILKNRICNALYISKRSIAVLMNNLIWQNLIYLYIQQPKDIHSNRYKVCFIYNKGLYMKYIYVSRIEYTKQISKFHYLFISIIEIQDLMIPKLEKNLLILYKILVYILINILGNSIIFIIRAITSGFYSNYK